VAARVDADGVTLQITFQSPPLLEQIRRVLKGGLTTIPGLLTALGKDRLGSYRFDMRPGFGVK
jgi:hypothetical protein